LPPIAPQQSKLLFRWAANLCARWAAIGFGLGCACVYSTLALKEGIDPADVQAIRDSRLPKDNKLAALSALAKTMIEKRGRLDEKDVDRFLAAGFGKDHLLEVIAAVAASTITNYTGSITNPPLEQPFQAHAWAG
jgi:alkylhydroperoxidase family enzyme